MPERTEQTARRLFRLEYEEQANIMTPDVHSYSWHGPDRCYGVEVSCGNFGDDQIAGVTVLELVPVLGMPSKFGTLDTSGYRVVRQSDLSTLFTCRDQGLAIQAAQRYLRALDAMPDMRGRVSPTAALYSVRCPNCSAAPQPDIPGAGAGISVEDGLLWIACGCGAHYSIEAVPQGLSNDVSLRVEIDLEYLEGLTALASEAGTY